MKSPLKMTMLLYVLGIGDSEVFFVIDQVASYESPLPMITLL